MKKLIAGLLLSLWASFASAQVVPTPLPYIFQPNTTISSSQLNADLNWIVNNVNTWASSGTAWTVPQGGTGVTSLTAHGVLIGEGTSPIVVVGPCSNGQVLQWGASGDPACASVPGTGTVTSITAGVGLSGGTITSSGTISLNLSNANTWTGLQTFTKGDLGLLGTSTGQTYLNSAASGATNYTITLPAVTDTVAVLGTADQTLSGGANLSPPALGNLGGTTTVVDCGKNPGQSFTNTGAFTLSAPTLDGECVLLDVNASNAGSITFSGFTVGSSTGDSFTTTSAAKFMISILRINSVATYLIKALQ